MKKAFLFLFLLVTFFACKDNSKENEPEGNSKATAANNSSASSIEGSWNRVWDSSAGVIREGKITQFKMFHDGYFSFVGQYPDGRWLAGAGTYTLEGNIYTEVFNFCTLPEYIGTTDQQEYELKNDTLYFKGFTKVIKGDGRYITDSFRKFEEKRVKAK